MQFTVKVVSGAKSSGIFFYCDSFLATYLDSNHFRVFRGAVVCQLLLSVFTRAVTLLLSH